MGICAQIAHTQSFMKVFRSLVIRIDLEAIKSRGKQLSFHSIPKKTIRNPQVHDAVLGPPCSLHHRESNISSPQADISNGSPQNF